MANEHTKPDHPGQPERLQASWYLRRGVTLSQPIVLDLNSLFGSFCDCKLSTDRSCFILGTRHLCIYFDCLVSVNFWHQGSS